MEWSTSQSNSFGGGERLEGFQDPESHYSRPPPVRRRERAPFSCIQEATVGRTGLGQESNLSVDGLVLPEGRGTSVLFTRAAPVLGTAGVEGGGWTGEWVDIRTDRWMQGQEAGRKGGG